MTIHQFPDSTLTRSITVHDGRTVAVHIRPGVPTGRTVLFCHAAPGAGLLDPKPELTAAREVTLIGIDRPGYGGSDPLAGGWPSLSAAAADAADVLDALEIRSVGVIGWSAGGRVALALAAHRPDVVDRVVVAATPAPHEDVPWIPAEYVAALDSLRDLPPEQALAALTEQLGPMAAAAADPDGALALVGGGSAAEAALAVPGVRDQLVAAITAAFAQGPAGLASDMAAYTLRPWGFEPADVAAKVLLLYGSADQVAGPAHGRWWQRELPNARLETVPGAGHLLVVPMWRRILSYLAPSR
jgi:pimeloyl-ACP methyl ester carboxylesterase